MTPILLRADREGERLDQLLARSVDGLTRSAAQRLLEEGAVTLNGAPARKNTRTAPGDAVALSLPDPVEVDIRPQNRGQQAGGHGGPPRARSSGRHTGKRTVISLRK